MAHSLKPIGYQPRAGINPARQGRRRHPPAKPNQQQRRQKRAARAKQGRFTRSYARFDLSAMPKDAQINLAMLRIWVNDVEAPGNILVHEVTGDWNERSLTAATVPAINNTALTSLAVTKTHKNSYMLVDVTQLVKDWQSGLPNNGLALKPDPAGKLKLEIDSKENDDTSHPMEIEVAFEGVPGPVGPQGACGSTRHTGAQR